MSQSTAILRFAGKLSGLYPEDPVRALKVDEILDSLVDLINIVVPSFYEQDKEKVREDSRH